MFSLKKSAIAILPLALAAFVLSGCKSTYTEKNTSNEPPPILKSNSRVYVAVPFDGTFKDKVAQGSGKVTAQAFQAAFMRYTRSVYISKFQESVTEAIDSARRGNLDYVLYPAILEWQDRATEWSGRRDRLSLKVELIDLSTSKVVFSREIQATGKWMTDGGETPNQLVNEPAEQYVNALFRRIEKPSALW